jgi:hypothetical protein
MYSSPRTRQTGAIIKIKKSAEIVLHGIDPYLKDLSAFLTILKASHRPEESPMSRIIFLCFFCPVSQQEFFFFEPILVIPLKAFGDKGLTSFGTLKNLLH